MKRFGPGLGVIAAAALMLSFGCGDRASDEPGASADGSGSGGDDGGDEGADSGDDGADSGGDDGGDSASDDGGDTGGADSTSGPGDDGGTDGGGFIDPPDGGIEGQCDPMAQDCPEDEKCTAYSTDGPAPPSNPWNANKCVPLDEGDVGQVGDPCTIEGGKYTGEDNCDKGFVCLLSDDEGNGGACVEFCNTDMECPESGGSCVVYNDGSLPICLVTCDPLLQDCADGQGCYNSGSDQFVCFKFSGMAGEGARGDECTFVNSCAPGMICLAPDVVDGCGSMSGCCSPYCDTSDPNAGDNCVGTEQCTPYFDMMMAPPGYEDVGVCSIPM